MSVWYIDVFPTGFALMLAIQAELIHPRITSEYQLQRFKSDLDVTEIDGDIAEEMFHKIKEFQEISTMTDYDTAVKIFHDFELTDKQKNALMLVAELTPTWAKGKIGHKLMMVINDGKTDPKVLPSLAQALLGAMDGTVDLLSTKGSTKASKVVKQFVHRMTTYEEN